VLKIFALKNVDDVSMNETAVCQECLAQGSDDIEDLYAAWRDAEDFGPGCSDEFWPVDNVDAVCQLCGAGQ